MCGTQQNRNLHEQIKSCRIVEEVRRGGVVGTRRRTRTKTVAGENKGLAMSESGVRGEQD